MVALQAAPDVDAVTRPHPRAAARACRSLPASVTKLTDRLTAGLDNPYDKAKAISDYFTDGRTASSYSLKTARQTTAARRW